MMRGSQYYAASWDSGMCVPSGNWVTHDFGNGGHEILLFNKKSLKTRVNKDNMVELYLTDPERTHEIPLTRVLPNKLIYQATIWTPQTHLNHLLNVAFQGTPFNNVPRIPIGPQSWTTDDYACSGSTMRYRVYFNRYIHMTVMIEYCNRILQGEFDHIRYSYCFGVDLPGTDPFLDNQEFIGTESDEGEVGTFVTKMMGSIQKILSDPGLYISNYPEENVT